MSLVYPRIALALIMLSPANLAFSQTASSAAASANAVAAAAARPAGGAQQPVKRFVKVHSLLSREFKPGTNSCFQEKLRFPVTNASDVAKSLASVEGLVLIPIPPDKIAIYDKGTTPPPALLQEVEKNMDMAASPFTSVYAIAVSSGSATKSIAAITLPDDGSIVTKAIGSNCVLVMSKSTADPATVAAVRKSISHFYWQQPSAPPTQRLFYLDASTVVTKLSPPAKDSGGSDKSENAAKSSAASGDSTKGGSSSPTVSVSVTSGGAPASAKASSGDGGDSADPSDQSNSDKPAKSSSAAKDSKSSGDNKTRTASAPTPKPPNMQAINDMLIYSNDDGTDQGIQERHRLIAVLDLPRPEVLMNIWSLQASSGDYKIVNAEAEAARELIAHHNDLLQNAIDQGWGFLSQQMKKKTFFNELFYQYVTQKFAQADYRETEISIPQSDPPLPEEHSASAAANADTNKNTGAGKPKAKTPEEKEQRINENRANWGWCPAKQYCLGFGHAFEPLRPTFTNLLIAMASADDSDEIAAGTVMAMEGSTPGNTDCGPVPPHEDKPCVDNDKVNTFRECMHETIEKQLHTFKEQASQNSCQLDDRIAMTRQIVAGREESLQLRCFGAQAKQSFAKEILDPSNKRAPSTGITTRAGLLRAAIADFLFNYKWATQYPHDFVPYDLTQSAQELNAEFNPLVLAFNQDVAAFTQNLEAELQCKYKSDIEQSESSGWFSHNKGTFLNDGMLSVRGISGVESIVDTVSQSFFDATNPPSLTDLVKSVADAEKNLPGVLKSNLSANEAAVLMGALNSVQPAHAKIGRELKLDITPHALAGASSAELEVKLTAEETADPTRFTADKSAEDTLSRIAKHDVSTRVRVESLKLFDVSAFSAMLQRPRSKFPLVPPFFEVPYFGSFIGWPIPGAKVYHRSTAIVSAVIVPTATDLAFGIDFSADRFCNDDGCHHATSPGTFASLPLRNFHKVMVQCFASGEAEPYIGILLASNEAKRKTTPCSLIDFDSLPPAD